jgi:hypothetical protein
MKLEPEKVEITSPSLKSLRNCTSGSTSEPYAAVAITHRELLSSVVPAVVVVVVVAEVVVVVVVGDVEVVVVEDVVVEVVLSLRLTVNQKPSV